VSGRKSQKVAYKWGFAYGEGLLMNGGFTKKLEDLIRLGGGLRNWGRRCFFRSLNQPGI